MHFLILSGLLFAAYGWINQGKRDDPEVVRITAQEVDWLREMWQRQWQRPPTDQELSGVVTDYLKQQLLAREASELGLHENDVVVQRRLAQKLTFLVQDTARLAEPADEDLLRLYETNPERYQEPARVSFRQVFFKTEDAARQGLVGSATGSAAEPGDSSLLAPEYIDVDEQSVTNLLGNDLAGSVFSLEPGRWHGPVESAYGFHLVSVSARSAAQPHPFDEARAQVLEEWHRARQAEATDQFHADLLKKYIVVVEDSVRPLLSSLVGDAP